MDGLYSIHVTLLDGRSGKGSGVIMFVNGQIRGGDAYLFYTGSYKVEGEKQTFKGEVIVNQHTPSRDVDPLFGGQEVSIGVTGRMTETGGEMDGTALVGRNSIFFKATLRRLADID